jgi:hypothetical protein
VVTADDHLERIDRRRRGRRRSARRRSVLNGVQFVKEWADRGGLRALSAAERPYLRARCSRETIRHK